MEIPIEIVRKAVISAVPEIVELKFGCRVLYGKKHEYSATVENWFSKSDKTLRVLDHTFRQQSILKEEDCKVLGRDIRLADVLVTVMETTPFKLDVVCESKATLYVRDRNLYGQSALLEKLDKKTGGRRGVEWNLREDSLEKQSQETISFLAELLGNK